MAGKKSGVKLPITVNGKHIYVHGDRLAIGSRSCTVSACNIISEMNKSEARRVRKALRKAGFARLAGTPRYSLPF